MAGTDGAALTGATVAHVMRPALVLPATTGVRDAAVAMTDADATAVLVRAPDGALAICTDRDLRTRVVATGAGPATPVAAVTTPGAVVVDPGAAVVEAVLAMTEGGFRHLPVVDAAGAVVGLVEDRDLLAANALSALHLHRAVLRAPSRAALVDLARRLPSTWTAAAASGLDPVHVGASVAAVVGAVVARAVALVAPDAVTGPAAPGATDPAAGWLAVGSLGRREVLPSSDVDCALVVPDDADREETARTAQAVAALLAEAGLALDTNGLSAADPRGAASVTAWRAALQGWADRPHDPDAAVYLAALLDARPLRHGAAPHPLLAQVHEAATGTALGRRLGWAAVAAGDGPGAFDVRLHARRPLDLKRALAAPVTHLARWAGAAAGTALTATPARLAAAAAAGVLTADEAAVLGTAFGQAQALRLRVQLTDLAAGRPPSDEVAPARLDPLTRRELGDLLRAVHTLRDGVRARLELERGT